MRTNNVTSIDGCDFELVSERSRMYGCYGKVSLVTTVIRHVNK